MNKQIYGSVGDVIFHQKYISLLQYIRMNSDFDPVKLLDAIISFHYVISRTTNVATRVKKDDNKWIECYLPVLEKTNIRLLKNTPSDDLLAAIEKELTPFDFSDREFDTIFGELYQHREEEKTRKYTYGNVAEDIVRSVIEGVFLSGDILKLKSVKIFDPACGSGSFLVKSVRVLSDIWSRVREKWPDLECFSVRDILKHNIYGVDIDPKAIDVAKFTLNLFAQSLEDQTFVNLDSNIVTGDYLEDDENKQVDLYSGHYDFVFGNPPWVKTGAFKYNASKRTTKFNLKLSNLSQEFLLEATNRWIKTEGIVAMILPDKCIDNTLFKQRLYNYKILKCTYFAVGQLYTNNSCCVIVLQKSNVVDDNHQIPIIYGDSIKQIDQTKFILETLPLSTLVSNTYELKVKLNSIPLKLKDLFDSYSGMSVGRGGLVGGKSKFLRNLTFDLQNLESFDYDKSEFRRKRRDIRHIFLGPKIIIRRFKGAFGRYVSKLDNTGIFCSTSYCIVVPKDNSEKGLYFALGYLHSNLAQFLLDTEAISKKSAETNIRHLDKLPMYNDDLSIDRIAHVAKEFVHTGSLDRNKLDMLVYSMFGLQSKEIDEIEKSFE